MVPVSSRFKVPVPPCRRLRHFAFDPVFSRRIDTFGINEVVTMLPWEDDLAPGPVDDYLEVVDCDPASQLFYDPVDLNDRLLLAQDGLPPSDSSPQFHQQMVYAVARTTIGQFERALGRKSMWAPNGYEFVRRLRIYPHALREANAYYSPDKKALLFGYFPSSAADSADSLPRETVFACLSHDIVAHETTHALLDGLHRRFNEPSNEDVFALHEAFADIVALFQHFTYPAVLRHQIARTNGDLQRQSLLGELAFQFGQAIGSYGALRSAIGRIDRNTNEWVPNIPDPAKLSETTEPHERGAILVAAVFDAFMTIYKARIADLLRIATGGTGVLPAGELHPDLVERLSHEASKVAGHVLQICIRALDYCPPVDVNFGDYLRALITADADVVTDDSRNYRVAFIGAFRRRGIYPRDVRNLSEESLLWDRPKDEEQKMLQAVFNPGNLSRLIPDWEITTKDRERIFEQAKDRQRTLHGLLSDNPEAAKAARIVLDAGTKEALYRASDTGVPYFEVHSVRPARRVGPSGQTVTELIVEITQRRRGYHELEKQKQADRGDQNPPDPDFVFRGGCTLVIDPGTADVRYCIYKDILRETRLDRMREYLATDAALSARSTYFGDPRKLFYRDLAARSTGVKSETPMEPFAVLHRSLWTEEILP